MQNFIFNKIELESCVQINTENLKQQESEKILNLRNFSFQERREIGNRLENYEKSKSQVCGGLKILSFVNLKLAFCKRTGLK